LRADGPKEDFENFDGEDEFDPHDLQFDLDELLELEAGDLSLSRQDNITDPEALVLPLNLKQSKDAASMDDEDGWETDSSSDYAAQVEDLRALLSFMEEDEPIEINGVEVTKTTAEITECERRLYFDPRLGCYRCQYLSPLRHCWTPISKCDE
jgi:hypothetical protein